MSSRYDPRASRARQRSRDAALARPELRDEGFGRVLVTTLRDAMKLKRVMQKRGLRRARAHCPECGGMLHGSLAGPKDHMRFRCDGPCERSLME